MRASWCIAASLPVHAITIAVVARALPAREVAPVATVVPWARVEPVPIEVALVVELAPPQAVMPTGRPIRARVARPPTSRDAAPVASTIAASTRTTAPVALDRRVAIPLPADVAAARAAATVSSEPARSVIETDAPRYGPSEATDATPRLDASGGFTSRAFTVAVADDGSARIRDNANWRWHLPTLRGLGERVTAWQAAVEHGPIATSRDEDIERPLLAPVRSGGFTIATFDVTDWAARARGIDPYASAKLRVLDATRDERARIGAVHRRDRLAHSIALVQQHLDRAWRIADPHERNRTLFELWDDCAESGDEDTRTAAAAARATVIGFIRARLPAGSPHAFTHAELAAFAREKRSREAFDPYGSVAAGRNSNG